MLPAKLQETIKAITGASLPPAVSKAAQAHASKAAEAASGILKHGNSLINNTLREKARADRLANQILWTFQN